MPLLFDSADKTCLLGVLLEHSLGIMLKCAFENFTVTGKEYYL